MGVMCTCLRPCGDETVEQDCLSKNIFCWCSVNSCQSWKPDTLSIECPERCQELCSVFATLRKNSVWIRISGLKQYMLDVVSMGSLDNDPTWDNTPTPHNTERRLWGLNGMM